ncbi:MAG TPA: helix-turn-helix transcriptional regulator [Allosphingosinicella sp.]|nr:helix-turn-helix transcriptional regulator [Allosphingosinicella sp.]
MLGSQTDEESSATAIRIREELARRRLSRQWLADEARVSLSTLEKALSGQRPFTLATVVRLEGALGVALRRGPAPKPGAEGAGALAPEEMGAYSRAAVHWLEGEYLTLRRSFSEAGAIYAYRTLLAWDEAKACLAFHESSRLDRDFEQHGFVSFPNLSGHIYLVTNFEGQYRVAILGRPTRDGALHGVLATLAAGAGAQLMPASTPIVLLPISRRAEAEYGLIRPGDRCHAEYSEQVAAVAERGYALLPA